MTLALAGALASCSKDSDDNCTWTSSDGNYFGNRPPTQQEIDEMEQQCGCTITITKECN